MAVFIKIRLPVNGAIPNEEILSATVISIHDNGIDLKLSNGDFIGGWHGALYDENGNEIPLETIRRNFAVNDLSALKARIEELEKLIAGMEV